MILSPLNCSVKMSPYERRVGIEQERTETANGVEQNGTEREKRSRSCTVAIFKYASC